MPPLASLDLSFTVQAVSAGAAAWGWWRARALENLFLDDRLRRLRWFFGLWALAVGVHALGTLLLLFQGPPGPGEPPRLAPGTDLTNPLEWHIPLHHALLLASLLVGMRAFALHGKPRLPTAALLLPILTVPVFNFVEAALAGLMSKSVHRKAWLCQGIQAKEVDDRNTTEVGGMECRVDLAFTQTQGVVQTTGIPNHDFESGPGCCVAEGNFTWRFPLLPTNDTDGNLTSAPIRGPIAIAVSGAFIFGPEDDPGSDAVGVATGAFQESRQHIWLGTCGGHSTGQNGMFHYHFDANCIPWHSEEDGEEYSFDKVDTTKHSGIIGFAFDGYPIYGSFGHDGNGGIKQITSSYRPKEGRDGSGGIADYEYVPGLGDLDECNGRWTTTPEFPQGTYAYFSTQINGEGGLGFPYFLNCYKGVVEASNIRVPEGDPPQRGRPPAQG